MAEELRASFTAVISVFKAGRVSVKAGDVPFHPLATIILGRENCLKTNLYALHHSQTANHMASCPA